MNTSAFHDCFINRELSWLQFNQRVLDQTLFSDTPVYEKLRFLSIFSSNLDEFFMVRVGSLFDQSMVKKTIYDNKTGMTVTEQLHAIFDEMPEFYERRNTAYMQTMCELETYGIQQVKISELSSEDRRFVRDYFTQQVLPLLSPILIDNRHPFPHLENLQSYLVCRTKSSSGSQFGLVLIKSVLDPAVFLPNGSQFVLLEDLFLKYANLIFKRYKIDQKCIARVTRNADLEISEGLFDEETDYRSFMKKLLKTRTKLSPVRLEIFGRNCKATQTWLLEKLSLSSRQCYKSPCPLHYSFIKMIEPHLPPDAQYERLPPLWPSALIRNKPIIPQIEDDDCLIFLPYHSIKPLLLLLGEAASNPQTVSIKICLYRLAEQSQVISYLCDAAENGIDVTVVLELRARFDERNNINWSNRLEEAGCTVLYGVDDYKVHSKILLITQKINSEIKYITHIGTGNYNEQTAKLYTDIGLITSDPIIAADAVTFFQCLSLSSLGGTYKALIPSPIHLKDALLSYISEETQKAIEGKPAQILLKMNSLTDKNLIEALIRASMKGVSISMIVRGICCLAPGIPGFTENIRVISVVGRFLEHSRIYVFGVGNDRRVFISSADWMTRNTERRVELLCPVRNGALANQLVGILEFSLRDNCRAWELQSNGHYKRITNDEPPLESQRAIYNGLHQTCN